MALPGEITRLIAEWRSGNLAAENALFEALYRELHGVALRLLHAERKSASLGPTALVHEAYLRFRQTQNLDIADSQHFLALAARVMRRILVDRARARRAEKRGADPTPVELHDALVRTDSDADEILAVDAALNTLQKSSVRQCSLVELRYFAGYTIEESAVILGISDRTARREWQIAKTRLRGAIDGPRPSL